MGHVIAFVPTSGGVGCSTLASAVAVRAAAAGRVAVAVDLDRFSGRLDVVLGLEQEPGWRWPDLAAVAGTVDGGRLLDELPTLGATPAVLTWPGGQPAGTAGDPVGLGSGTDDRLADVDDWLERSYDVVAGLVEVADVVVLDCPRDDRVLAALADLVDVVVLVAGAAVSQVAAAGVAVPLVRAVMDGVRLGAGAGSTPACPPLEPWVVLRGVRVADELQDLIMDHLDVPVLGVVGDDRRLATDLAEGRAPGSGGRGPVVEMADRLLLRLVSSSAAA
jgi:MinD-like ATPase involved in chromosome partitioning or flagellar assembly